MGRISGVMVADGTGVAVNVNVEVGAGIVEVAVNAGEVGVGVGALLQAVPNKLTTDKNANIFLI
jgi:hypothetical protein